MPRSHFAVLLQAGLIAAVIAASPSALAAGAPIVDASGQVSTAGYDAAVVTSSNVAAPGSSEQRLNILEKQMDNLTQMDITGQVNALQQQVAQLRGQLDEQNHQIQQLTEQLKAQYQDLDQRLAQSSATTKVTPAKPVATKPSGIKSNLATTGDVVAPSNSDTNNDNDPGTEQRAYQTANQFLRNRDYVRATTALQDFLGKYPNSDYAANSHYWLGEIYLQQGQPDQALSEFNTVVNQYPLSPKVPDAMLKLGFAYADKGDVQRARVQLQKVKQQFPGSTTAQLAIAKLHELGK